MRALVEVADASVGNSIQDLGRFGYRHMGITVSGCIDPLLARCANVLAGNPADAACIEIRGHGPTLEVRSGRLRCALAGEIEAELWRADGSCEPLAAWRSVTLERGDSIAVGPLAGGSAYLALSGGLLTPPQLGSRSTYQRAGIGGIDGRLLRSGDLISCAAVEAGDSRERRAEPWRHDAGPLRLLAGPQDSHFKPSALEALVAAEYRVTPQLDRMGVRLEGPALEHLTPQAADIVSDGVTPGVLQVPGNGQPIILLADCQTVGGYPKIATVISADLPRLGQLRPGQALRFALVDRAGARAALLERELRWHDWLGALAGFVADIRPLGGEAGDVCCFEDEDVFAPVQP